MKKELKSWKDKFLLNSHVVDPENSTPSGMQGWGRPCSVGQTASQAFACSVLSLVQAPTKMSAQLPRFAGDRTGSLGAVVESCGSMDASRAFPTSAPWAACSWPASFLSYTPTWSLGPKRLESVLQRTKSLVCSTCSCAFVTFSQQVTCL